MRTKNATIRLVLMAMLSAMAYIVTLIIRIPVFSFLSYDPKNVIILVGSFLLGPIEALVISLIASFVEMITFSDTGWWGFLMNVLSTVAFILPPALLYKRKQKIWVMVLGIVMGIFCTTGVMLLWNYLVAPLYMGIPRDQIIPLLTTVFLPFNVVKGIINGAFTLLIFVPLQSILDKSNLIPAEQRLTSTKKIMLLILISIIVIASCIWYLWL